MVSLTPGSELLTANVIVDGSRDGIDWSFDTAEIRGRVLGTPHAFSLFLSFPVVSGRWPTKSYSDLLRYYFGRYTGLYKEQGTFMAAERRNLPAGGQYNVPGGREKNQPAWLFPPGYTVSEREKRLLINVPTMAQPDTRGPRFRNFCEPDERRNDRRPFRSSR